MVVIDLLVCHGNCPFYWEYWGGQKCSRRYNCQTKKNTTRDSNSYLTWPGNMVLSSIKANVCFFLFCLVLFLFLFFWVFFGGGVPLAWSIWGMKLRRTQTQPFLDGSNCKKKCPTLINNELQRFLNINN